MFPFNKNLSKQSSQSGSVLILTMVYIIIFLFMGLGIAQLSLLQSRLNKSKVIGISALDVAEAGVNYYRWHLAHDQDDYQDGTGEEGPYVHEYYDPYGGLFGYFSLEIEGPISECSKTVLITSTGWLIKNPKITKIIKAKYSRPALAKYAFLTNEDIWLGDTENISGELHSNGGVRMDGTSNSRVMSAKETYTCKSYHGCSPPQEKPGVWGSGGPTEYWDFPVPPIDFEGITVDLANLEEYAETNGFYLPQLGPGYHLKFQADGTVDIYWVKQLKNSVWGYNGSKWVKESHSIENEEFQETFTLAPDCNLIFVKDDIWVSGEVKNRTTVVSARLPDNPGTNTTIVIPDNLTYVNKDGTDVLGLIAQKDILVPLYSPDDLEIDAAMLAQKGHLFRYYYCISGYGNKCSASYSPWYLRNSITVYGSIITNTVWTWSWDCGGYICSGYEDTHTIYDPELTLNPPPFFPTTGEFTFVSWEELLPGEE